MPLNHSETFLSPPSPWKDSLPWNQSPGARKVRSLLLTIMTLSPNEQSLLRCSGEQLLILHLEMPSDILDFLLWLVGIQAVTVLADWHCESSVWPRHFEHGIVSMPAWPPSFPWGYCLSAAPKSGYLHDLLPTPLMGKGSSPFTLS